jgi:hypothetical protein
MGDFKAGPWWAKLHPAVRPYVGDEMVFMVDDEGWTPFEAPDLPNRDVANAARRVRWAMKGVA